MSQIIKRAGNVLHNTISKINKNIVWLIWLNVVIALSQFIVYSFINKSLGKEILGVWSLVVAATSIGQISSFGFSSSLVRYLPEMFLKNQHENITRILGTINFSNFFLTLPILLLLYFPAIQYAEHLLNQQQLLIFKSVIPLSMAGLFINNLFSVYSYLLDAMQKYYLRCIIQIIGWVFFLMLSILLMPGYGLNAVAIAFVIQNLLQFVLIVGVVSRFGLLSRKYPLHFDKTFFRQVFSFGLKSQYINILVIFFDPLVKFFITKDIGLASTGYYELSNKIVMQARNLLVSTNQVIIPKIILNQNAGTENNYFNEVSFKNVFYSVSVGMLVLLFSPLVVILFSNEYDSFLMQCIIILNFGWVCNMITSVHYYCCIGLDKMGQLVIYHLVLSITVVIFYFFLSRYLNWKSLYFAIPAVALFIGSIYISWSLSKRIHSAFSWLKSGIFLYFIIVSLLLFIFHHTKTVALTFIIMPVFFLPYIFLVFRQYKTGKLFNPQ